MWVITPIDGREIAPSSRMFPGKRAPISSTTAPASGGASSSVIGSPISLLNDAALACTTNAGASAAAVRSFVDVLPAEPVTPMTAAPSSRRRASTPSARECRVRVVDHHERAVHPVGNALDERQARAVGQGIGDELVTVALGAEGDEPDAGIERAGVEAEPARDCGRPDGAPARDRGDLVPGQVHASDSSSSRATTRSSNRVTTPATSCPDSWPLPAITTTSFAFAAPSASRMAVRRSSSTR